MKAPKTPEYEFGGPIGATGIVFGLPILMQLLYLGCNDVSGCPTPALLEPRTLTWQKFKEQTPWPKEGIWGFMSWEVTGWLFAYYFLSLVLYQVLPAQEVYGTKLRESGKALKYRFNSFSSSVVQLVACAVGTYIYGAEFPVWTFMTTNYIQLLTTSTVLTFIVSLYVYIGSFSVKKGNPELRELARGGHTGRIIYDFFIGRELNPRVTLPIFGEIDIKSWLEMRTALTGWILFNCAFIAQQYRNYGYVSDSILVIATVQAYYVLEGQYSELGLLSMMDITQDGLGFMLTWGNMVWVPFLYSTQCRYLSLYPVHLGPLGVSAIATVFAIGLYIFRSSNNQKALFRKDPNHPAFGNMTFIQTKRGTKLLTGGWWGMARHINYFGDWLQSLPFSLPTKFAGYVILPAGSAVAGNEVVKMLDGRLVTPDGAAPWGMLFTYFYSAWFGFLLIHRERRDDAACIEKYGKDWDEYKSKALRFADQQRCTEEATHANELFCLLHARQAHGLYIGYKRRNAQLDALDENPPDYLAGTHIPLANDDFDSVDDRKEMEEIIDHLHVKWNTLNRVIEARRKHHAHFYSISYDYGHQAYIDKLVSHRHIVLLALGRARKRLIAILYKKEQWYSWVRDAQDDEELCREKEQKKLKQEAALFKHDEAWDPIEDMEDEQRHRYIDLIKHFLWMEVEVDEATAEKPAPIDASSSKPAEEPAPAEEAPAPTKKLKNKKKNKGKTNAAANSSPLEELQNLLGQKKLLAMQASGKHSTETELKEPDKKNIETEEEMRKRLSQGVKKNLDNVSGMQLVGTIENPHETWDKTAPMEDDEIDELIRDIREIKLLLFCRLVLLQASLLPAALRATTVQEFLDDTSVTEADLRDLCLKVSEPTLQDIRDACADFACGDNADDDLPVEDDDDDDDETMEQLLQGDKRYHHLHTDDWFKERVIKEVERRRFFKKKTKKMKRQRKTKVKICGKSIWNHASENAMSRDGWLQFSVMAKDCDLKHAIQLCRNWSEFSDLNLLTLWQYFPASNWTSWGQDRFMQQLQQLGFFPYFTDFDADKYSHHHQIGGRSQGRRQHDIVETRNILVGNMKRNDPVTRRFLQYLLMRRGELLVMVRDGKTGRVITAPDDEQLWTYRKKQGLGRASKNDWFNILEVGPDFMKLTDILREWRFGFDDYYDVFIWDFVPGEPHMDLYNIVVMELRNAWRMRTPRDMYVHMESLLRSLHRNEKTMRTRQIKPGENLKSLWDTIADERSEFRLFDVSNKKVTMRKDTELAESPYMFYNKANEVEDAILFPDELTSDKKSVAFREIRNGVASIEDGILPSTARHFVKGLEAINKGKNPMQAMRMAKHEDQDNIWGLPKVWETALLQARSDKLKKAQKALLQRTGLLHAYKTLSYDRRLEESDPMEMMERDRAFSFKESFHAGDLEPGYNAKYNLLQETLRAMLKTPHVGSTDWIFFIAEILEWLDLRGDYDDYVQDPQYPWPHSFIVQDIVQAFAMIAMFFPRSDVAKLPTMFVNSSQCDEFRKSGVFDPKERSKVRPDRRTRTSYKFRDKEFWKEWKEFYKTERYFGDVYPMEWSLTVRPIIAHLYQAGVIAPAYMQNHPEVVLGMVTANKEPHRPEKLDLFINYQDQYGNFPMTYPPTFVDPSKWPQVIPTARTFSSKHPTARFAVLRLWSAPHYYPFMVGMFNRRNTSFLDSRGRSWEWKFVPKDMPGSEFSAHHTTGKRLDVLKDKFGDRVVHRGDLILVMGVDEDDLLRFCTAVTFAMQTKPWLREIDLWKSFINVDFEFLPDLESFWLD
ncbi:major facilitator superfamily transporter [Fusarium pseudocircinatum]|uniref:Delta(14)-sterol reductase n=1 Tax=Fusarium pseudocircinatum TaxID=56676 RepID=A0A8H5PKY6_9HYPO|nr:major facilitator superfamily transporter [Fusarium pseudocircinatum]